MVRKETTAKRYAKAFFERTPKKELEENQRKIKEIVAILNKNPKIIKILLNPQIPYFEKEEIIKKVFSLSQELLWFILLLIERKRLNLLPLILIFFNNLLDCEMKRRKVILTCSFPVSEQLKKRLIEKLTMILKMDIILEIKIDPEIIGGAILQIGSKRIDGSIYSNLRRFEEIWQR